MKTFNASDMAHKRTEIFEAAREEGVIIQKKNTNGEVLEEFVMKKFKRSGNELEILSCQYDPVTGESTDWKTSEIYAP